MKHCPTCRREFIEEQTQCPLDDALLEPIDGSAPKGLGEVLGKYRLLSLIAEGGMGRIFIAGHLRLKRFVAIKRLSDRLRDRRENIVRFFDEARTVNKIKHPNIVEVIDLVEDAFAGAYLVLELLNGPDLRTRLDSEPIGVESAIYIAAQIADALSAVHGVDIVHRDLKPDNIVLIERGGRDDFVKLIDFGVAQMSTEEATGVPFGTAAYMSPEQATGGRVDHRSDIYSLGVVLFEMLSGRHPFPSTTDNEYLMRHADDPVPSLPSRLASRDPLPRELNAIVRRCLAKDPGSRYETASAVAVALRGVDVRASFRRRKIRRATATGGVLVAGAALALFAVNSIGSSDPEAAMAPPDPPVQAAPPAREPAVPPDARPAPHAERVELSFRSEPAGAQVYRVGESIPLGVTPFEMRFIRGDRTTHLKFLLDGHEPHEVDVSLARPSDVEVSMVAKPVADEPASRAQKRRKDPKRKSRRKQRRGRGDREGVMDPFAK